MAVLIKGQSIRCTERSRNHYLKGEENENIEVLQVSGFATKNADEALRMIEASAQGTRCQKPVYSAKINPETDRLWTKEEALKATDGLETNLGLTGHARVVVEHIKHGRTHYHVLWSRFSPEGGAAKNMGNDYAVHQKTQNEIEKEFGLRPMMAKGQSFRDWEVKWAERYGFDIFKVREFVTEKFNEAKSGQSFMAQMETKGVVLCRGDKDQFIIILPWGQHKALSSMIHGRPRKAEMHQKLADIDLASLPTVQEGKAQVTAKLPKIKRTSGTIRSRVISKWGRSTFRKMRGSQKAWSLPTTTTGNKAKALSLETRGISPKSAAIRVSTHGGVTRQPHRRPDTAIRWKPLAPPSKSSPIVPHQFVPSRPAAFSGQPRMQMPVLSRGPTKASVSRQPKVPRPQRSTSRGIMSEAQYHDYVAACEGRITWQFYFAKWGRNGLSL